MTIRAITFDVYSALFDTVAGLRSALDALLEPRGAGGDPGSLAQTWRRRHMEYLLVANSLDRTPASNRAALAASARQTLRALHPPLTSDELSHLIHAWETLPPWAEAVEVLTQVRRRTVILGTLSNGDTGMLQAPRPSARHPRPLQGARTPGHPEPGTVPNCTMTQASYGAA